MLWRMINFYLSPRRAKNQLVLRFTGKWKNSPDSLFGCVLSVCAQPGKWLELKPFQRFAVFCNFSYRRFRNVNEGTYAMYCWKSIRFIRLFNRITIAHCRHELYKVARYQSDLCKNPNIKFIFLETHALLVARHRSFFRFQLRE